MTTKTAKKPVAKEGEPTEPVGRADLIVNAAGQTVPAENLPDATDVAYEDIDVFGDTRSITLGLGGTYYKLDTQAALYLGNALRALSTNLSH